MRDPAAMVTTDKARRLSDADRAGYQARSPEGHAARGMSIRGQASEILSSSGSNYYRVTLMVCNKL